MRRPKDQARTASRDTARREVMDDNFDPIAPKAANAILPSETKKKTTLTLKKEKLPLTRPGAKDPEKPIEAPTAEEPKAATPAPKKPKAQPKAKPEAPVWQPPENAVTIFEKPEYTKPIGYTILKGKVYEAYTCTGQRLAIGLSREKTEENFRGKFSAHRLR